MRRSKMVAITLLLAGIVGTSNGVAATWKPAATTSFSIILSATPATISTPAAAVDLDLFDARQTAINDLRGQGKHLICYLSAGSWENWRPDKDAFPPSVRGKPLAGWPGERWLDIRKISALAAPIRARLNRCKARGFHAVDPDNIDGYQADSGFQLTRADAIRYVRFLAAEAHARGLAIGLKNIPELSAAVLSSVDFAVTEDCFDQGWCQESRNFVAANKPVFAIEYTDNGIDFAAFCRRAKALGLSPLLKQRNLGAWERRCPP